MQEKAITDERKIKREAFLGGFAAGLLTALVIKLLLDIIPHLLSK